jgi:GABA(A) receptor-associated protein
MFHNYRSEFRRKNSEVNRKAESRKALHRHPDRKPLIVERSDRATVIPDLDRKKYLVPDDMKISQLLHVIRSRGNITPAQALFVFVDGGTLVSSSDTIESIYSKYKSSDGLLYITYCDEATFG